MANEKHLAILNQGVIAWNHWRKNNKGIVPVLSEVNFSKKNLCEADLNWANFRDTNLSEANLSGANLSRANLSGVNLNRANLSKANLSEANLSGVNLNGANLSKTNLSGVDLSGIDWKGTQINEETILDDKWRFIWIIVNQGIETLNLKHNIRRIDLTEAILKEVNFAKVNLAKVNLGGANLSGANLSEANLYRANLSVANLSGANLSEANLSVANLYRADLSEANLNGANLSEADLSEANLYRANLNRTNLSKAVLSWANLSEANLSETNFTEANLYKANLSETNLYEADINRVDLTTVVYYGATANFLVHTIVQAASPVKNATKFFDILPLWNGKPSIPGIILYTDEDKNLSSYIKENFESLDKLTGDWCTVFLLECPPLGWEKSRLYWKEIFENKLYERFHFLNFLKNRPYNKSEAYDIARKLKVDEKNLPCLILFNSHELVNEYASEEKLVFCIKEVSPAYFRNLFCDIKEKAINSQFPFQNIKADFPNIIQRLKIFEKEHKDSIKVSNYNIYDSQFGGGIVNGEIITSDQIGGHIYNTDNSKLPD